MGSIRRDNGDLRRYHVISKMNVRCPFVAARDGQGMGGVCSGVADIMAALYANDRDGGGNVEEEGVDTLGRL